MTIINIKNLIIILHCVNWFVQTYTITDFNEKFNLHMIRF